LRRGAVVCVWLDLHQARDRLGFVLGGRLAIARGLNVECSRRKGARPKRAAGAALDFQPSLWDGISLWLVPALKHRAIIQCPSGTDSGSPNELDAVLASGRGSITGLAWVDGNPLSSLLSPLFALGGA